MLADPAAAVVTLIVRARMQGMDESLEQAANDLYATPLTAFRQITLPLIAPAVMAGGLLAFTFALDNVIISDFVKAPGTNTFPTYVLGQVKTVRKPDIAAMATLLLGVTLLALIAAAAILRGTSDAQNAMPSSARRGDADTRSSSRDAASRCFSGMGMGASSRVVSGRRTSATARSR